MRKMQQKEGSALNGLKIIFLWRLYQRETLIYGCNGGVVSIPVTADSSLYQAQF